MGENSLALTPARNWGHGNQFGAASSADDDPRWSRPSTVLRPLHYRPEEGGGLYTPWRLFEERVRTGPYGLTRFPSQPHSPIRILVLDGGTEERVNPRLRQFIRDSPPRIRGEWHLGPAREPEEFGLTNDEFKKAMKKLKKQVYNPPYPKSRARKRGLFSNWSSSTTISSNNDNNTDNNIVEREEREQGKECAICLEAFVATEQVLVTPCNHMFHNDCLVPWVKSQGQCPVCRLVLGERREALSSLNNYNYGHNNMVDAGEDNSAVELIALIRAMEEAFNWVSLSN